MQINGHMVDIPTAIEALGIDTGYESNRNIVAKCPWPENHSGGDSKPSFAVSLDNGKWICYTGCGAGNLTQLVERLLNFTEKESEIWLTSQAGSSASFDQVLDALDIYQTAVSNGDIPIYKVAQADHSMADSKTTSSYILERGFTYETLRAWDMRYDKKLRAIVIPVCDMGGEIVGVVRRMVPPVATGIPKYMFTYGFDKSKHLFGAYKHPKDGGPTIIVEGPLDAIWLHQHGYTTAVGLMGAYCSRTQVELLRQLGSDVMLALDNDKAGQEAAERLADSLSNEFAVSLIPPYRGKDVQELDKDQLDVVLSNPEYLWQ